MIHEGILGLYGLGSRGPESMHASKGTLDPSSFDHIILDDSAFCNFRPEIQFIVLIFAIWYNLMRQPFEFRLLIILPMISIM